MGEELIASGNLPKSFQKYFLSYAEKEIQIAKELPRGFAHFSHVIGVPVCDEREDFPLLVDSLKKASLYAQKKILLIAVVNHRTSSADSVKDANRNLLKHWSEKLNTSQDSFEGKNFFGGSLSGLSFLFIDRATEESCFHEKEGVGLARKIASDLAAYLKSSGLVLGDPIFTTDADARLPENFFILPRSLPSRFFMISPFKHETQTGNSEAILAYEEYMRSYVDGLKYAGSPYGFHTIGSCIAFSSEAYVQVRGFPKSRLAGEDFYFLSKVSKVADFIEPVCSPILLSSRLSERVPFGTGQAVKSLQENKKLYPPYDKKLFEPLRVFLVYVEKSLLSEEQTLKPLDSPYASFLKSCGYLDLLKKVNSMKDLPSRKLKRFHDLFDAFNTLRFIQNVKKLLEI